MKFNQNSALLNVYSGKKIAYFLNKKNLTTSHFEIKLTL